MSRKELLHRVIEEGIIGVVREETAESASLLAHTLAQNGVRILEVTLTSPDAYELMTTIKSRFGGQGTIIAAGTVRNSNDAALARRAGADIIVSPHTDVRIIEYANENDMLCIAGAATATEIIHAWEAGCDIVKVYPAMYLGGPNYIRTLRQPIRDVPMLAGGPVPLDQIDEYLDAGAVAVNLGASLAVPDLVATQQWDEIGRRALLAASIVQSRRKAGEVETSYIH